MKLDVMDLSRMPLEELQELHKRTLDLSVIAMENASLPSSVPGKKLQERLEKDLEAIRSKYMRIDGTEQEVLQVFHFTRGREYQILQELELFKNSESIAKEFGDNLELISIAIENANKIRSLER